MGAFFYHLYLDWKYVGDDELMQTIKAEPSLKKWAVSDGVGRILDEERCQIFTDRIAYNHNGRCSECGRVWCVIDVPSEQREKAEKIVRDSMPQAVKDIVDGVHEPFHLVRVSLDDWISLHKLDIDAVIRKYIPNYASDNYDLDEERHILDEERRMWVLHQPSLKKWAVSDGVVI